MPQGLRFCQDLGAGLPLTEEDPAICSDAVVLTSFIGYVM